ncbi:antigen WC1.1-like [Gymnodraco acuticeps]|uniref:Antigen WC1.1-like n=1 Tax=Gymnodraco acuticeps TaxID=8218 RepID=A0A6P8UAF4_GYMAC|nr:antigen WC1.1-like [Gymnodraco acuticeps]
MVGGKSRCAGELEVEHEGEWRPVVGSLWNPKTGDFVCRQLDCGSAVSVGERYESSDRSVWGIGPSCVQSGSALRKCAAPSSSKYILNLTCSDSVRLLGGTGLCSGRLEVNSDPSDPSWSSVCEADFDQQDAQVVCRQLGCGAPSVLQRALYGEGETPMGTKEFQCGGHESALLDCSSASERSTCSPGTAVSLTCSEPVRLVGGESRCAGDLEVKYRGEWIPVEGYYSRWTPKTAGVACRELDCGSAFSVGRREESSESSVWEISSECVQSGSALRECAALRSSQNILNLTCSDSVRLLGGTALCSGRLEVNSDPSDPSWSSVCEADFDQQDAQVVCRQLGCGAPSVLQGALYGEGEAPMGTKEFQCGGHESALLDCSSASERNTCSPGTAVSLTCSEPGGVQLVGGESRCAGDLELKHQGEWRPVEGYPLWTLKTADPVCRELDCGSAFSVRREESSERSVWWISPACVESGSALRECAASYSSLSFLNLICSDKLFQPNITVSSSMYGVSGAKQQGFQVFRGSSFTISCSIQPQYPGGSFQLNFTSINSASNYYSETAVNHSAHFLFPAAEPAHQGSYSCVYHVSAFSQDFSSESRLLSVTVTGELLEFTVGQSVMLPSRTLATRGRSPSRQEDIELDYLGVPAEEEGAQGAE